MHLEQGQVAVITGAASGIGRAVAQTLTCRGLAVVLVDVEAGPLADAATELRQRAAGEVMAARLDVGDAAAMSALARRVLDRFGRVDLLGNVAGVFGPRAFAWEQPPEDWQWTFEVNLWGVVNGVRAFVPAMVEAGSGHIVNVASIAGLAPVRDGGNAPYVASKYAVVGLSEALRIELDIAAPDVGVTVVCPGPVATRIREAERNRPESLRALAGSLASSGELPPLEPAGSAVTAEDVAEQIVGAVESNRLYLLPNPGTDQVARARVERLLGDLTDG